MPRTRLHIYHTGAGDLRVVAWTKGRAPRVGRSASWDGPTTFLCDQPKRLKSGACTWVETKAPVKVRR